jgi:glycerol uptake facilitator-like aquaporin
MTAEPLLRRMLAEYVGSAVLVAVVVGSGISAQLRSDDAGVQRLVNSLATVGALGVLISVLGPASVPAMLAAQLLGAAVGVGLTVTLAGDRTRRTGPAVAAEAHR